MNKNFSYLDNSTIVTLKGKLREDVCEEDIKKAFLELRNIDLEGADINMFDIQRCFTEMIRDNGILSFKDIYDLLIKHNAVTNVDIVENCAKFMQFFEFFKEERYSKKEVAQMFRMRNMPMFSEPSPEYEKEISSLDNNNVFANTMMLQLIKYCPTVKLSETVIYTK